MVGAKLQQPVAARVDATEPVEPGHDIGGRLDVGEGGVADVHVQQVAAAFDGDDAVEFPPAADTCVQCRERFGLGRHREFEFEDGGRVQ